MIVFGKLDRFLSEFGLIGAESGVFQPQLMHLFFDFFQQNSLDWFDKIEANLLGSCGVLLLLRVVLDLVESHV